MVVSDYTVLTVFFKLHNLAQLLYRAGGPISWQTSVGLTLIWDVPPSYPAPQPVLPISHQPRQNQAEGGTAKIKVTPTQVCQEMGPPVQFLPNLQLPKQNGANSGTIKL